MNRLLGLLVVLLPLGAWSEVVGPIEAVENFVNIRMSADSKSEIVGRLNQGDFLPLVSSNDDWLEVQIAGGATGFISADWVVVHAKEPVAVEDNDDAGVVDAVAENSAAVGEIQSEVEVAEAVLTSIDQVTEEVSIAEAVEVVADNVAEQIDNEALDGLEIDQPESIEEIAVEEVEDAVVDAGNVEQKIEAELAVEVDSDEDAVAPVEKNDEDEQKADAVVVAEIDIAAEPAESVAEVIEEFEKDVDEESAPTAEELHTTAIAPAEQIVGPQGMSGPPGPQGEPGPPGPPGAASIEGTVGYLTRFTAPTVGASSQVYDDGNNVGIGTTTPVQRLEVNGNIQIHEQNSSVAGLMITQSDGETGYIMHNRASTLTIGAGSIDRITIDADGNVGIGVSRPSHPIEMTSGAHVTAGGVWTNSSSRERKENIAALSAADALAALSSLEPVEYNYKNDQLESYVGFIAEDVPDLVATADRDALSPMDIVAVLTKVVQEQQKQIEALEARLDQR